jgi:tRNA (guanine-N7-)-methyltransferase
LEIGTGNGEYAVRQSLAHPDWNLLGIDLHWGSVRRALRKVNQAERTNIRLMQVNAKMAVEWLFRPESLEHVYALFPCPWPKRQHIQQRLFSQPFLKTLAPKLKPGGSLMVVTDHSGLRDFIFENLEGTGLTGELKVIPASYDTKYERRWEGQGQSEFFECHLTRPVDGFASPSIQLSPREVTLYTHYSPDFQIDSFKPQAQSGPIHIQFKRVLFDPREKTAMILAAVMEDDLTQSFWISVHQVGPDRWSISPAPGGGVLPTAGVQRSLDLVYEAALASIAE